MCISTPDWKEGKFVLSCIFCLCIKLQVYRSEIDKLELCVYTTSMDKLTSKTADYAHNSLNIHD